MYALILKLFIENLLFIKISGNVSWNKYNYIKAIKYDPELINNDMYSYFNIKRMEDKTAGLKTIIDKVFRKT